MVSLLGKDGGTMLRYHGTIVTLQVNDGGTFLKLQRDNGTVVSLQGNDGGTMLRFRSGQ